MITMYRHQGRKIFLPRRGGKMGKGHRRGGLPRTWRMRHEEWITRFAGVGGHRLLGRRATRPVSGGPGGAHGSLSRLSGNDAARNALRKQFSVQYAHAFASAAVRSDEPAAA